MGIPNATVVQLVQDGISTVSDLADFNKNTLQQVADNLRRPGGRIPDPAVGAAVGATIPTPPFVFGAKSHQRLLAACEIVRYYETTGRALTAGNITWTTVVKNFDIQWQALRGRKDGESPEVPKITKALPIIKWTQAFTDYLHRKIGARMIPLAYVIREDVAVPAVAPALVAGQPHSEMHGSVEGELIARASHTHALYRDDNSDVYFKLEEATRSTSYAASIKPFQRGRNGRAAWLALTNQYAGQDKWEQELKKQDDMLHTRVWRGQSNFTLERFVQQHRNAFVSMQSCAEYVQYQLPTEHTRVGYLLAGINCNDAGLQAAMASVQLDTGANGLRNDFEATATHLLPYDPVAKKRSASHNKRGTAEISDATGIEISSFAAKEGIGSSGVHLRYYKHGEYDTLSQEQKEELREWRKTSGKSAKKANEKGRDAKRQKKEKDKAMVAAVEKQVEKKLAAVLKDAPDDSGTSELSAVDARAYIMSLFTDNNSEPASAPSTAPKVTLKSILKRAKNSKRG